MKKLIVLAAGGSVVGLSLLFNANLQEHKQFYLAAVHVWTSQMVAVASFLFALYKLISYLLFGTLKSLEVEVIQDQMKYSIIDTVLALSMFSDDLTNPFFLLQLQLLMQCRCLGWTFRSRVEYFDWMPMHGRWKLVKTFIPGVCTFLLSAGIALTYGLHVTGSPSYVTMFLFEFVLLAVGMVSQMSKLSLFSIDAIKDNSWRSKTWFVSLSDLTFSFHLLALHLCYFAVLYSFGLMPIHLVQRTFGAFLNFMRMLTTFIQYNRALMFLKKKFPLVAAEELDGEPCIICRDDNDTSSRRLPCGHVLHTTCLQMWLEKQQSCPLCRRSVFSAPIPRTPSPHQEPTHPVSPPVVPPPPEVTEVPVAHPAPSNTQVEGETEEVSHPSVQEQPEPLRPPVPLPPSDSSPAVSEPASPKPSLSELRQLRALRMQSSPSQPVPSEEPGLSTLSSISGQDTSVRAPTASPSGSMLVLAHRLGSACGAASSMLAMAAEEDKEALHVMLRDHVTSIQELIDN